MLQVGDIIYWKTEDAFNEGKYEFVKDTITKIYKNTIWVTDFKPTHRKYEYIVNKSRIKMTKNFNLYYFGNNFKSPKWKRNCYRKRNRS